MSLKTKKYKICDTRGNLVCYAMGLTDSYGNIQEFRDMDFSKKGLQERLESMSFKWRERVLKFYEGIEKGKYYSSVLRELCGWWNDLVVMVAAYNKKFVSWDLIYNYLLTARVMPSEYKPGALESFKKVCERSNRYLNNALMERALLGEL